MDERPPSGSSSRRQPEPSRGPLSLLVTAARELGVERRLDVVLETTLEAGRELCDADCGAFFYTSLSANGAPCPLFKVTGMEAESFPLHTPDTALVEAMFGNGIVRCADILPDAHFGLGTPFAPLTQRDRPYRSYFAIPIHTASGELLGGLLYLHGEPHHFVPECEAPIEALALMAALAIDNTLLREQLVHKAVEAGSARQLTEEKATSDRRLRQALDAGQLGTWTWNRATDMLDLDERAAQIFNVTANVPVGRSELRERIVFQDDRSHTVSRLEDAIARGTAYHAEYRITGADGNRVWISSRGIPTYRPGTSEIVGMVGTLQDITLRRTQEEALRQSEKLAATGRLAATIAHEINNPLEAVTNLIYLVKTDPSVPEAAHHLLETADQELARVAQIAQQTLGFYRDTTRPADIDLGDLLRGVVVLFQRKLSYKKIDLTLDLEPNLYVFGLQGELRQVFSNLLVNAIDASLHGHITVRARHRTEAGTTGISVLLCDEGHGVPAGVRDRLFSPFFTTKPVVGTGLGLWVTRGIVEKQGGNIRFRSSTTAPTGTVFRVFLPAVPNNLKIHPSVAPILQ